MVASHSSDLDNIIKNLVVLPKDLSKTKHIMRKLDSEIDNTNKTENLLFRKFDSRWRHLVYYLFRNEDHFLTKCIDVEKLLRKEVKKREEETIKRLKNRCGEEEEEDADDEEDDYEDAVERPYRGGAKKTKKKSMKTRKFSKKTLTKRNKRNKRTKKKSNKK